MRSALGQDAFQMPFSHHGPIGELDATDAEDRAGIAHAARLEVPDQPFEVVGGRRQVDLNIHALVRAEVTERHLAPGQRREPLAELLESPAAYRQAGGHAMPTVTLEQVVATRESGMQVEA